MILRKKKGISLLALVLTVATVLTACSGSRDSKDTTKDTGAPPQAPATDLGGDSVSFGEDVSEQIMQGYFEENANEITVTYVSGTPSAYRMDGNTLLFDSVSTDSVYTVSGRLKGNILIKANSNASLTLELDGFSLVSEEAEPICVAGGKSVTVTAKSGSENYIYDCRPHVEDTEVDLAAFYSAVDLTLAGKGSLTVVSENNNGIQTKDLLHVKELTLTVHCADDALRGNDGVTLESGNTTLIATEGDGVKASNSSVNKGKQKGSVTVSGGTHTVYAACDGIDAAYDVVIEGDATDLRVYTDKYSAYSEEVTATSDSLYYIRFDGDSYLYSVKYYNSDEDWLWVNAEYHSETSGGIRRYSYYSFPKMEEYVKMQFFIYSSDMEQGQENEYLAMSEYLTPSTGYDTFALESRREGLSYSWTNYTTSVQGGPGGFGGMQEGNPDKSDYSTKGIKAANAITVKGGSVSVKAYDDAVHAGDDVALDSGKIPVGNVTVEGGALTLYSHDDGIHADGNLTVNSGTVHVSSSYEGLEGATVCLDGGSVSVYTSDDGINATAETGNAVAIRGGSVYIRCGGDGIDTNSYTTYEGILFTGGKTVIVSTSGGNSAIDTERGYTYEGGCVVAVMPRGGMTNEAIHCADFTDVGTSKSLSAREGEFLIATVEDVTATVKMPDSMSAVVIVLGDNHASVTTQASVSVTPDGNGVHWTK